jgi:integral membrane protein
MEQSPLLKTFRKIGIAEGISFLVLVFIAMPFKYILDIPEPVKYFGWAHGVLFIAYGIYLLLVTVKLKWTVERFFIGFFASLLPFGPFLFERSLKKEYGKL